MSIWELRKLCKENNIPFTRTSKKSDLVNLLQNAKINISIKGKVDSNEPTQTKVVSKKRKTIPVSKLTSLESRIKRYEHLEYNEIEKNLLLNDISGVLKNYDWTDLPELNKKLEKIKNDMGRRVLNSPAQNNNVLSSNDVKDSADSSTNKLLFHIDEFKPSVSHRLQHINALHSRLNSTGNDKIKMDITRELNLIFQRYNWHGYESLMNDIKNDLVEKPSVISKPINIKPVQNYSKSRPPKRIVPPMIYSNIDLPVDIFNKNKNKLTISFSQFKEQIENPKFIADFTQSVRELMRVKKDVYTRCLQETKKEYGALSIKIAKLKKMGMSDATVRDMYPGYDGMSAYVVDIENVIELVHNKMETITEADVYEGMIDAIYDPEDGICALIGRDNIKDQIASRLYSFSKGYRTFFGNFNNIAIYGATGTGKTRLAKTIAFAFSRVGILAKDMIKIVTRTELVGQYIGQTAPRTRSVLLQTLEGVLFIDEAYQLAIGSGDTGIKDYGNESITEIVNFLDKYIGLSVVIVAGYENLMKNHFMTQNEGLSRRFPYRFILTPYTPSELTDILIVYLKRKVRDGIHINDTTANLLYSIITKMISSTNDVFCNQAGDMLNLAGSINNAINSSFCVEWNDKNPEANIPILMAGFDDFMDSRGHTS